MLRTGAVIICGLLLCLSLVGANAALAVDRGPMNPDHTAQSLEEAGAYDHIHQEILDAVADEMDDTEIDGTDVAITDVIAGVVDADLIGHEVERNADGVYAYLQGDVDELLISFDSESLKDQSRSALEAELQEIEYAEFGYAELDEMLASAADYDRARLSLRAELLGEFDASRETGFGHDELVNMFADEERYAAQVGEFHDEIVLEIMTESEADAGFGNDRLATLLESEEAYANKQSAFRTEQKERIQAETDKELSDAELQAAYEERQDDIYNETKSAIQSELVFEDVPPGFDSPTTEFAELTAKAFVTDLAYLEFQDRYDESVAYFESELKAYVATSGEAMADDVGEHVTVELPDDVPESVAAEGAALEALVIEAMTTEMPYDAFVNEYDRIGADIEEATAAHAWDNRVDYEEAIESQFAAERADVPDRIADELGAIEEATLEAAFTDLDYEEYSATIDTAETDIVDTIVVHVFEDEEMIPDDIVMTENLEEDAGDEIDLVRTVVSAIGPVIIGLFLLSAVFAGGIFAAARSAATGGIAVGLVGTIVGGLSFAGATVVPDVVANALTDVDVPAGLDSAIPDFVAALLSPLATQSLILLGIGSLLIIGGVVFRFELISLPLGVEEPDSDED